MIDSDGYRANVGIVLCNAEGEVFWARRYGQNTWQFPQGGIREDETPVQAMYRELYEETGLEQGHVEIAGQTSDWLRYEIPHHLQRHNSQPLCIGQKQIWFSLRLIGSESDVNLFCSEKPEFEEWRWVHYWQPVEEIISFKKPVYQQALKELEQFI